jgi:hypothetical protein
MSGVIYISDEVVLFHQENEHYIQPTHPSPCIGRRAGDEGCLKRHIWQNRMPYMGRAVFHIRGRSFRGHTIRACYNRR